MINYILDISHWNGRGNFQVAKEAGAVGTFIRFGSINSVSGIPYEDYIVHDNVQDAKDADFPFGAYFYMRPKFSGTIQGRYFLDLLDVHRPQLPAVIDVEEVGDFRNVINMANMLVSAGYRTAVYTRQQIWDYNFPSSAFWSTLDLWAARWTSADLNSPWGDGRFKFRDWNTWKFWQYSADGNARAAEFGFYGGDPDIDISYYNGSAEEYIKEYNLDMSPPTHPDNAYTVGVDGLYIRQQPYVGAKILGFRNAGDVVLAEDYGGGDFWVKDVRGWSAVNHGGKEYMRKA